MAATGFTPIKIYASSTASSVPLAANLDNTNGAELAINTADGRLFYKDSSGVVQTMASKGTGSIGGSTTQVQFNNAGALGGSASLTWSGTVLTSSGFAGPLNGTVGATTPNTGAFTTLSASSTVSGTGFSTYLASPPAIGGTAAAAGSFTTLNSTGGALNGSIGATTASTGAFTTLTAATSITNSSLTTGRIVYTTTGGLETSSANLLYSGTDLTVYGLTVGRGAGAVSTNTAVGANALLSNSSNTNSVAVGSGTMQSATASASNSTALGYRALFAGDGFSASTAVGSQALYNNSGQNNTAVGYQAGYSNTTGTVTAVGFQSLNSNTTGTSNVALGAYAGQSNTTNNNLTAIGANAAQLTTVGVTTAVGAGALISNTTGADNTAIGDRAMYNSTTGSSNTALGSQPLRLNTTGANNTALGYQSLFSNTTASSNTAVGYAAAYGNTTGTENTAVGVTALYTNTTGSYNTALGRDALRLNTTASYNTALGYQAGYNITVGEYNTYLGGAAANAATTGTRNTFIGYASGSTVTTGDRTSILGRFNGNQGGLDIRTSSNYIVLSDGDGNPRQVINSSGYVGIQNTVPAAPLHVGSLNGTGSLNGYTKLAVEGTDYSVITLKCPSANFNQIIFTDTTTTSLGGINYYNSTNATPNAMAFNVNNGERMRIDSSGNLLVGQTTAAVETGSIVTAKNLEITRTIDSDGAALGQLSWVNNTNAGIGSGTSFAKDVACIKGIMDGTGNNSGGYLTFETKADAGTRAERMRIDASGNVLVGTTNTSPTAGAGMKFIFSADPANPVVKNVVADASGAYSTWNLYSTNAGAYRFFVTTAGVINATTIVITAISDQRLKENIRDIDVGLDAILALKPRRFDWKSGKGQDKKNAAGFIAQEFEDVFPECVGTSEAGEDGIEYKNINHETLIPTLVKAIQEQQALIQDLTTRLAALEAK